MKRILDRLRRLMRGEPELPKLTPRMSTKDAESAFGEDPHESYTRYLVRRAVEYQALTKEQRALLTREQRGDYLGEEMTLNLRRNTSEGRDRLRIEQIFAEESAKGLKGKR